MDYKEKIEEKRKKVVDTLISFIEQDPTQWEAGWYRAPSVSPMNGKTQKNYKGLNAFYLYVIAAMKGYRDPRWLTFNQVKELGGNVRNGEKSSEVFFWTWYDKKTKKPFEAKTLEGMSEVLKIFLSYLMNRDLGTVKYNVLQIPYMNWFPFLGSKSFIDYAHKYGIACQFWTINEASQMETLIKNGADCIMSDNPKLLYEVANRVKYGNMVQPAEPQPQQ